LIRANIQGVGVNSTNVDITDSSGASLCESVEILSYGVVNCQTKKQEINASSLKVMHGTASHASAVSSLTFAQLNADSGRKPSVSSVSKTATTIVFTGSNFGTSAAPLTGSASFMGVDADSVNVDSATQVTATWTDGVPLTDATGVGVPTLRLTDSSNIVLTAIAPSSVSLTNAPVIPTTTAQTCSFAGGCLLDISSPGLTQMLKSSPATNYVTVCDNRCSLSASSSATSTLCKLPPLSTSYSDSQMGIQKSHKLNGTVTSSGTNHQNVFDGDLMNSNSDSSSNCHI
jgi:hypothetical protein